MMQSPESFRLTIEDHSLEQLRKERDRLSISIRNYEKFEIVNKDFYVHPFRSAVYHCENLYLIEVLKLIVEKSSMSD